jgi:pimeloyl-ACP methyl ester carboxylesterase
MPDHFDALWLSASPSLQCFDHPLQLLLTKHFEMAYWQYFQGIDEGSSIFKAVELLEEYFEDNPSASAQKQKPLHLIGHGISGVIGLLYTRLHPERVKSLTLLAVGVQPTITWHSHYHVQRHLLPCSRSQVLVQMVRSLFGPSPPCEISELVSALDRDLEESPCIQSLFNAFHLPRCGVPVPLMVCGSRTDSVVDPVILHEWLTYFKPKDLLFECPEGRHFFHYFYPQFVSEKIISFWRSVDSELPTIPFLKGYDLVD